jgi:hypothetical protein
MASLLRFIMVLALWGASWSAMADTSGYELFAQTKSFRFYANPNPPKAFRTLANEAEAQFAPIAKVTGYQANEPTNVYLTLDHDSFINLGNPSYAIGIARPLRNEIAVTLRDKQGKAVDIFAVFRHEVSHIALLRAAGANANSLPRWFVEGFAEWQANEHSVAQDAELLTAARLGKLLPLSRLDNSFPDDDTMLGIAYAQSAVFVRYLVQAKGEDAINQAVARVASGAPFGVAMREGLGDNLASMELRFLDDLKRQSSWFAVLMDTNWLWGITAVLFVLAYTKKRKAIKLAMKNMIDEEPPMIPGELVFLSFAPMVFSSILPQAAMNDDQVKVAPKLMEQESTGFACNEQVTEAPNAIPSECPHKKTNDCTEMPSPLSPQDQSKNQA